MPARVKNPKNIPFYVGCSDDDMRKLEELAAYFETSRADVVRMLVNLKHVEVTKEQKKAG